MDDNNVAVLLEDLLSKFRTFGEGIDGLRDEMNNRFNVLEQKLDNHINENRHEFIQNRQEHQQIIQAVQDLDNEVKRLDTEVIQIKRVSK